MAKLIKSSITLAERMHDAVAFTNGENIWLHHNLGRHYASIALLRPTKSNSPQERVAVCQPASYAQGGRQVGSTGDTHAAEAAAGNITRSLDDQRGESSPSHQASPHGLASRGLFSLADKQMQARAEVSCHPGPMQRCQEVQKLLISGRGCIEMRVPAGELRISTEPGFPA